MINYNIGEINEMQVKREAPFGVYLDAGTGNTSDDVLLPTGSMTGSVKTGDTVPVFIYRDSEERIIATMKEPLITLGQVRRLKVVGANQSGAFVDIGLERDVFVARKEQKFPLEMGKDYLFKLYVDKTDRLAASTDVFGALELPEEGVFEKDQSVTAHILARQQNGVLQAAIADRYKAVMFKDEYFTDVEPGDTIEARILKFLDDGKPSLTLRSDLRTERLELKDEILKALQEEGGSIPYNDRSTPDELRRRFNTSKNYFKIALGNLMKAGKVYQDETGTHLKETDARKEDPMKEEKLAKDKKARIKKEGAIKE